MRLAPCLPLLFVEGRGGMQLLAKGFLLIKDNKLLESGAYLDFIVVFVALRKRM